MVVQHNLTAMNTNRQLGIISSAQAKTTEKLSSGYRINRAGDDAAGLSISEKMRSQIRGLNKASSNAQDGISAIQVAEGALNETHDILQRMNELATQAANDTNTSTDRTAIKAEIDQLISEIDRIQSTTQFNTMNLLDGNFTGKNLQVGALSGQNIAISIGSMHSSKLGVNSLSVSDNAAAGASMKAVQSAIELVSTQRSELGAIQNRLEHTIANLDNVV
jgi:flagellin